MIKKDVNQLNESYPTSAKKRNELKGVGGWLAFFVFSLIVSAIVNFILGIEDVYYIFTTGEFSGASIIWLLVLDIFLFFGIIFFDIYTVYAITKHKPNAVSLAKMTLILTFLTNVMSVIFTYFSGTEIETTGLFSDSGLIIRSIIFSALWYMYLTLSKRIKNTFPLSQRNTPTLDKVLFCSILAIPIVIYQLAFIGILEEQGTLKLDTNKIQTRTLSVGEYSDGRFYFLKPEDFSLEKKYAGVVPLFVLQKGEDMSISLLSDNNEGNKKVYFDQFYKDDYEGASSGYDLDISDIKEDEGKTKNGLLYYKKSLRIIGEQDYLFGVIVVFDDQSQKVAGMSFWSFYSDRAKMNSYLESLLESIKFS